MEKDNNSRKIYHIVLACISIIIVVQLVIVVILSIQGNRGNKLQKYLDLGNKYIAELDYEQAIIAFQKAIEIDPKCEEAYKALVDIYIETEDYEAVLEILEMAVDNVDDTEYFEEITLKVNESLNKENIIEIHNEDIEVQNNLDTLENDNSSTENVNDVQTDKANENITKLEINDGEYVELTGTIIKRGGNIYLILDNPAIFHRNELLDNGSTGIVDVEIEEVGLTGVNNSIVFEDIENKRVSVYGEAFGAHTQYHFSDVMILDGYANVKVIDETEDGMSSSYSAFIIDDVKTNDVELSKKISSVLNEVYDYGITEFDEGDYDLYSILQYMEYRDDEYTYERLNGEDYEVFEESVINYILRNFRIIAPKNQIGDILYIDNKYYIPIVDWGEIGQRLIVVNRIFEKNGKYEVEYTIVYIYPENFETGKENPQEDWSVYYDFTLSQIMQDEFCEIEGTGNAVLESDQKGLYITEMTSDFYWDD
jgi:tetratricopeptide (TPR) repeat protein